MIPLLRSYRIPEFESIVQDDFKIKFKTIDNQYGAGKRFSLIDLESNGSSQQFDSFKHFVEGLPSGTLARFSLNVSQSFDELQSDNSRKNPISDIGFIKKELFISVESEQEPSSSLFEPISSFELIGNNQSNSNFSKALPSRSGVDLGSDVYGVIRLRKFATHDIDETSLASALDRLPLPYECVCTVKPIESSKIEFSLRGKLNRDQFSKDVNTNEKVSATASAIQEIALNGARAFDVEWLLVIKRKSESELRTDLEKSSRILSTVFEPYIETWGALPSLVSSKMGSLQHYTQTELSPTVLYFLPICSFGEGQMPEVTKISLPLHRTDGTLTAFDPFDKRYTAFNTIITGRTGSGKSVFGNVLSQSLLQDPNLHMIKVDVGGSYKRECNKYNGTEIEFHLDKPSGVDPFSSVFKPTKEIVSVLAELLSSLSVEENEETVSKSVRSSFEQAIEKYYFTSPKDPSLHDFLKTAEIPRLDVLSRFGKGGVFENAISSEGKKSFSRYAYFNFANIQGASNKDYSNGIMASVIAYTNIEMIHLSSNEARKLGKRLVFFCDETKFFIEKNANFFLLTTANFRKFGHAVVLAGQNIEDFYLKKDGQVDRGLILNSFNRIFLATNCPPKFLREEFSFSDRIISLLRSSSGGREYRDIVIQDEFGTRSARLYLTPNEYWSATSSRHDVDRIERLKSEFKWLSERQIIDILSLEKNS